MPVFVVEDGTGLDNATSYIDVPFADDYLRSGTWAPDLATKEDALMQATEYADVRWGKNINGEILERDQSLEFPRYYIYDHNDVLIEGVPDDWQKAIALYAQQYVKAGTLYPATQTGNAKEIKRQKTVVGPITTEKEFVGVKSTSSFLQYPRADRLAKQFASSSGTQRVIR